LKAGQETNVTESVLEQALRETRSLGMGLVIIDQTPAFINKVATSNVFTNIFLSLQGRANVSAAADALLLNDEQKNLLGRLPVGMAVCKMQDHWTDPFLLKIPLMNGKQGIISDQDVMNKMKAYQKELDIESGLSGLSRENSADSEVVTVISEAANKGIGDDEKVFLLDMIERPYVGMTNRYKKMDMSTRHGNLIQKSLEQKGMINVCEINTGKAQVRIPELTKDGAETLRDLGHDIKLNGSKGGMEHRYWQNRIADHYKSKGYKVIIEKNIGDEKRVDIEALKDQECIAIEVETGKSDAKSNVAKLKARGYTQIILAPCSSRAKNMCYEAAKGKDNVSVQMADTFRI